MAESSCVKEKQPNEHIQVFVRCRPPTKSEYNLPVPIEVNPEANKIIVRDNGTDKSTTKTYSFDKVFAPDANQEDIFTNVVAPVIKEVIQGLNCTIFAYGHSFSGKSFTMEGSRSLNLDDRSKDPLAGIIPRSAKLLFDELTSQDTEFNIYGSYLELYNEEILDLLSDIEDLSTLKISNRESLKGFVKVKGLRRELVRTMQKVNDMLDRGYKKKKAAAISLDKVIQRIHTIFTLKVNSKQQEWKYGKINFVELGERSKKSGNINKSLIALQSVLTAIAKKAFDIPFRHGNLSLLLQDSLGEKKKTAVIALISPTDFYLKGTIHTLEFASSIMEGKRSESPLKITPSKLIIDDESLARQLQKEEFGLRPRRKRGQVYEESDSEQESYSVAKSDPDLEWSPTNRGEEKNKGMKKTKKGGTFVNTVTLQNSLQDKDLLIIFQDEVIDRNDQITEIELSRILSKGIWPKINPETVRFIKNGLFQNVGSNMSLEQLSCVWKHIKDWHSQYENFDFIGAGQISPNEFKTALSTCGFNLPSSLYDIFIKKLDLGIINVITFSKYLEACVMLQCITAEFKARDTEQVGNITVSYEDLLMMVVRTICQ